MPHGTTPASAIDGLHASGPVTCPVHAPQSLHTPPSKPAPPSPAKQTRASVPHKPHGFGSVWFLPMGLHGEPGGPTSGFIFVSGPASLMPESWVTTPVSSPVPPPLSSPETVLSSPA